MSIDIIGANGSAQGEVASKFLANGADPGSMRPYIAEDGKTYVAVYKGGDPSKPENYEAKPVMRNSLQVNGTLRRDEWKTLDEAVLRISETRLIGIKDLVDNNLVYNVGNGMGSTVLEYHSQSDGMEAAVTMDGISNDRGDKVTFTTNYLPLPITHSDYKINSRVLAASRSLGNPLDVTNAERAARKVNAKLEDMLFTDTSPYQFGGGAIYSYVNEPNRNQVTLSTGWDDSAKTAAEILQDVRDMKKASINAKHYGPWMLYVPTAYETTLDEDYDTTRGNTIRQRILAVDGIMGVKVADALPADNVILAQMTSDVVRLVRGMPITNVEWDSQGGLVTNYKVMTIQVPQVRADDDGNSGIVHLA